MGPSSGAAGVMTNPRDYALPGNQEPDTPWPDSMVLLSAIAAVTTRLRLALGAIIAPLRHPLLLAKQLATLDLLSEGRLVVLPTVSWHRDEYEALGVPFNRRGALLDEHLAAWRACWRRLAGELRGRALRVPRRLRGAEAVPPRGPDDVVRRQHDPRSAAAPPRGVRARLQPARPADPGGAAAARRGDAGGGPRSRRTWSGSAASAAASPGPTTSRTSTRRCRRCRSRSPAASAPSASSRRCSRTTPPTSAACAATWSSGRTRWRGRAYRAGPQSGALSQSDVRVTCRIPCRRAA